MEWVGNHLAAFERNCRPWFSLDLGDEECPRGQALAVPARKSDQRLVVSRLRFSLFPLWREDAPGSYATQSAGQYSNILAPPSAILAVDLIPALQRFRERSGGDWILSLHRI